MSWHPGYIDGPISIPILSEPDAEGARTITGYVPGYHLNIAPEVMNEACLPYRLQPNTPERVFAGAETVFLSFPDEATARNALGAYWSDAA